MTRVLKFWVAGLAGFVLQIGLIAALVGIGVHYLIATAIAVEVAILANFVWHQRWTWNDRPT